MPSLAIRLARAPLVADILEQYVETLRDPVRVHGICEEYRAAATIDFEHDQVDKDAGNKIHCPTLHLWGEGGPLDTFYGNVMAVR